MRLVIDASVAVKWFVEEENSDFAGHLLESDHDLYAPRLMASEIGNALWRKVQNGELEFSLAGAKAASISELAVRWTDDEEVCPDALRFALALKRPMYDCVYLALAHRLGATLVTADIRFVNALMDTEHGGTVVSLESFARQ